MNKVITILLLAIVIYGKSFACLNGETKILKDGTILYSDREGNKVPFGHDFYDTQFNYLLKQLDSLYKATKDPDYLSDKGYILILLKKYDEAIKLYLEIEKKQPNRYSTASNIGTAYELIGQNEKALHWIKKSVELNAESHHNSEWIHVNILKAKLKGEAYNTTSFLLNTDFGKELNPGSKTGREKLQQLSGALYYQLNERISFVKPKEKIVAQLLFDLGNIAFLLGNFNDAAKDYELAGKYGLESQLLQSRAAEAKRLLKSPGQGSKALKSRDARSRYFVYGAGALGVIVLSLLIIRIYKRSANKGSQT